MVRDARSVLRQSTNAHIYRLRSQTLSRCQRLHLLCPPHLRLLQTLEKARSIWQETLRFGNKPKRFRKRKMNRKGKHVPSQGDTVLISYLEPNRPDIAQKAGEIVLNSASQSEDEEGEEGEESGVEEMGFVVEKEDVDTTSIDPAFLAALPDVIQKK